MLNKSHLNKNEQKKDFGYPGKLNFEYKNK